MKQERGFSSASTAVCEDFQWSSEENTTCSAIRCQFLSSVHFTRRSLVSTGSGGAFRS